MNNTIEVFEERRGRLLAALRMKRPIYVALVSANKAFGGPEEGGWYFDTLDVVEQTSVDSIASILGSASDLKRRYSNEDRHRPESVLCRGWYQILVRTEPAVDEPRERPHYG
jgi:hypothetical protein